MSDFTYCIVTTGQRSPFVFCHYDLTLEKAIEYAKQQMLERPIDYITIREGTTNHQDPIVWDSREEAKPDNELAKALEAIAAEDSPKKPRPKPRYKMANPKLVPCIKIWPHIAEGKGKYVAKGYIVRDGQMSPNVTRTSWIININLEEGYIETLNSIYEIV